MKIIHYCQHVLGIGHYFRSLEIARALWRHRLVLVSGGPAVEVQLPAHVTECRLPGLEMDPEFATVAPTDGSRSLEDVQQERRGLLYSLFEKWAPDLFLVELYPFGRKRFGFELVPLLEAIHGNHFGSVKVVCSLRDILVEKRDQPGYEQRVLALLNRYFHALLVHADPRLVSLEETFYSTGGIRVPIVYTGFVAPKPGSDMGAGLRTRLGIRDGETLVVASAGGGRVGEVLLRAVLEAHSQLEGERHRFLYIFTGPFMNEDSFNSLTKKAASAPGVRVGRFTSEFLSYLAAADLSVSLAGYNTCMNILAVGVPALVWPFGQNREQRVRAKKLAALGVVTLLNDQDLEPWQLAKLMEEVLSRPRGSTTPSISLDGAQETARWLEEGLGKQEGTTND
ncbi:MAG: glycosyl transferase [Deltaproteobacteria bacterium]|nr:MAG: glycosyl transferase [Deltaproteobacteria bacterium]